jgi:hypothetical protein
MKLFKQLAIVALFCCGQSLTMHQDDERNALRQERIAIHNRVYGMDDRAAAQQLRNLHLNDVIIRASNNQYSVHYATTNRNFCPATVYLFVIESLNNLRDNHPNRFNLLVNFVRTHNANDDIPDELIIPAMHEDVASLLLQRVIRHIILNDNVMMNEPDAFR